MTEDLEGTERIRTVLTGYTTGDLAQMAGVHPSRVRQLLDDGTLHGEKRGRDWIVYRASAEKWLKERQEDAG